MPSKAILYYEKPGRQTDKSMKEYGENSSICRRIFLYQNFLFTDTIQKTANCSDLCDKLCTKNIGSLSMLLTVYLTMYVSN